MSSARSESTGRKEYRLQVSSSDRAAGLLLALLILLGTVVLILLAIWLTNQVFLSQAAVPVELMEIGDGDGSLGSGMELAGPTDEEIGEETDLEEPAVQDTLAAVADAVGAQAALLDDPALTDEIASGRGGGSRGDGRIAGTGSGSGTGTSRHWEVRFIEGNTLQAYGRQLDFFGIELAVLLPQNQVAYALNLSSPQPTVRNGPADQENRYYLTWRGGELQQADRELLTRAGIQSTGRIILKFLPPALEAQLAAMEKARADAIGETARRTQFGIRARGDEFEFYIMNQSYR